MVMIYLPSVTERAKYIFDLYFRELLGVEFRLTDRADEFISHAGPAINYSSEPLGTGLFIRDAGLLFEKIIAAPDIIPGKYLDTPVIFTTFDPRSVLPFDPFSAGFFLVTRYEEYLPFTPDKYGRYKVHDSIAHFGNFLNIPVINRWALILRDLLLLHYPTLEFNQPSYRFIPTIDIDHAYAYSCRGALRIAGSYYRSLLRRDWADIRLRTGVLLAGKPDPFDTFAYLDGIHREAGLKALYFVLFADYGGNDNNVSLKSKRFTRLIKELDRNGTVGIHPSLSSNKHGSRLYVEIRRLSGVLGRKVTISRQHFLKVNHPKTCRRLIEMGITDDYSMGYASAAGFKAGIANPFNYFDLQKNQPTTLRIHPVGMMDVTFRDYLQISPEEAIERLKKIISEIKSVNGEFVSLWHNESLSDTGRWKGWRRVYEEMVQTAAM
jgi:hypothetical protein